MKFETAQIQKKSQNVNILRQRWQLFKYLRVKKFFRTEWVFVVPPPRCAPPCAGVDGVELCTGCDKLRHLVQPKRETQMAASKSSDLEW